LGSGHEKFMDLEMALSRLVSRSSLQDYADYVTLQVTFFFQKKKEL